MIINRQRTLIANPGETADDAFAAFAATRLDESYRLARLILRDDHEDRTRRTTPSPRPGGSGGPFAIRIESTPGSDGSW